MEDNIIPILRDLLLAPCISNMSSIYNYLKMVEDDEVFETALEYACSHLESWPDEHRRFFFSDFTSADFFMTADSYDDEAELPMDQLFALTERETRLLTLGKRLSFNHHINQERAERLLEMEELRHFNRLEIAGQMSPKVMKILIDSPLMQDVKALTLDSGITPEVMEWLVKCKGLLRLEELTFLNDRMGTQGMQLLAQSPILSNVYSLEFTESHFGMAPFIALAQSPHLSKLTELIFVRGRGVYSGTPVYHSPGDTEDLIGFEAMVQSPNLQNLEYLTIRGIGLGPEAGLAMGDSAYLQNLKELFLEGPQLGDEGIDFLLQNPNLSNLKSLKIVHDNLSEKGAQSIANCPYLAELSTLVLSENQLGDDGFRALIESPFLAKLQYLDLMKNPIGPASCAFLQQSPTEQRMETMAKALLELPDDERDALEFFNENELLASIRWKHCQKDWLPNGNKYVHLKDLTETRYIQPLLHNGFFDDIHSLQCTFVTLDGVQQIWELPELTPPTYFYTEVRQQESYDGLAHCIAQSPHSERLEALRFTNGTMSEVGLHALATSSRLTALTHLSLHLLSYEPIAIEVFGNALTLPSLQRLHLCGLECSLDDSANVVLAKESMGEPDALAAFIKAPLFGKAKKLSFGYLSAQDFSFLHTCPISENLQVLEIYNTEVEADGLAKLLDNLQRSSLEALYFRDCGFEGSSLQMLLQHPALQQLKHLGFKWMELEEQHFQELTQSPYLTQLETLAIDGASISVEAILEWAQSDRLPKLSVLTFDSAYYSKEERRQIEGNERLQRLELQFVR